MKKIAKEIAAALAKDSLASCHGGVDSQAGEVTKIGQ